MSQECENLNVCAGCEKADGARGRLCPLGRKMLDALGALLWTEGDPIRWIEARRLGREAVAEAVGLNCRGVHSGRWKPGDKTNVPRAETPA